MLLRMVDEEITRYGLDGRRRGQGIFLIKRASAGWTRTADVRIAERGVEWSDVYDVGDDYDGNITSELTI